MIAPGATLGMLGGGQLGRMFASEARRMGYDFVVADPDPLAPAAHYASHHLTLSWDDPTLPERLAERCVAVTTEWENVPAQLLAEIAEHVPVFPGAAAVGITQDRIREKSFLNRHGVPTVAWREVSHPEDAGEAFASLNASTAILKTARLGYDGKGQAVVSNATEAVQAAQRLGSSCILEQRITLACEVSVMVARSQDGTIATWPVTENVHRNGILHTSTVPAAVAPHLADTATTLARKIIAALDYVGVMGVEFFIATDGEVFVNELAPRPHNSGHWTIEGSVTSQFEQQVRILAGLPLGSTDLVTPTAMINLLGELWPEVGSPAWENALLVPHLRLHLYGKHQPRAGRKMGHLSATAADPAEALERVTRAWQKLQSRQA